MTGFTKERKEDGFTLIELLVALTIFALGLLSIAGMQISAIKFNSTANTIGTRATLAQKVMEEIVSRDASDVFFDTAVPSTVYDLDPSSAATSLNLDGGGEYQATYTLSTNDPISNVSRIVVTITGPLGNDSRTTTLTSFKRAL